MGSMEGGRMEGMRTGMHKEYLEGLDNLRRMITALECEEDEAKREFYVCEKNEEDLYERALKKCNDQMLYCNNKLRKNEVSLQVIDSELSLMAMLNNIREVDDNVDPAIVGELTEYWERIKDTSDILKRIRMTFETKVLKRLQTSCVSYHDGVQLDLSKNFHNEVRNKKEEISRCMKKFDTVAKSFEKSLKQDQFTKSSFLDRVLLICDPKAFPILRFIPDLTEKLSFMFSQAKQWIDKDETYVHDISNHIRETRSKTRRKQAALRNKREKQSEMTQGVERAYELFKSNKLKLRHIEKELKTLDAQMSQRTQSKKCKLDERRQKEGIVGFLDISISQTRKNYSLQLKRSRLMRQLRDLEEGLKIIEEELDTVEREVSEKLQTKAIVSKEVGDSDQTYKTLQNELDKFNESVNKLEKEVLILSESVTDLETIQNFKTSPEKVEDLYERPTSVKLAPSLKEKILRKRKIRHANERTT